MNSKDILRTTSFLIGMLFAFSIPGQEKDAEEIPIPEYMVYTELQTFPDPQKETMETIPKHTVGILHLNGSQATIRRGLQEYFPENYSKIIKGTQSSQPKFGDLTHLGTSFTIQTELLVSVKEIFGNNSIQSSIRSLTGWSIYPDNIKFPIIMQISQNSTITTKPDEKMFQFGGTGNKVFFISQKKSHIHPLPLNNIHPGTQKAQTEKIDVQFEVFEVSYQALTDKKDPVGLLDISMCCIPWENNIYRKGAVIMPTKSWTEAEINDNLTVKTVPHPEFGESLLIGEDLKIRPIIHAQQKEKNIFLELSFQQIKKAGDSLYEINLPDRSTPFPLTMPKLESLRLHTVLCLKNGERTLIGKISNEPFTTDTLLLIYITATIQSQDQ